MTPEAKALPLTGAELAEYREKLANDCGGGMEGASWYTDEAERLLATIDSLTPAPLEGELAEIQKRHDAQQTDMGWSDGDGEQANADRATLLAALRAVSAERDALKREAYTAKKHLNDFIEDNRP